jgi:hypothetical protein
MPNRHLRGYASRIATTPHRGASRAGVPAPSPRTAEDRASAPFDTSGVVGYRLSLHWQRHAQALAPAYHALGRFILATNVLDEQVLRDAPFDTSGVLTEYKKPSEVERGFRFLKDPWFMADAVFLKTPRRIEALMRVMTLCLRGYNVGQHWLRRRLAARGRTLPSQGGKPTAKPTLRWVFQLMEGVHGVRLCLDQAQARLREHISHLDAVKQSIIRLFGLHAQAIHGVT